MFFVLGLVFLASPTVLALGVDAVNRTFLGLNTILFGGAVYLPGALDTEDSLRLTCRLSRSGYNTDIRG